MKYDFDKVIDRRNTNSIKYDFAEKRGMPPDLLPLWVADMDFSAPKEVTDALLKVANHAIFGYSDVGSGYFSAVHDWFLKYFDFDIKHQWLVKTPGVVFALAMAVKAYTEIGDAVLIQTPVYPPFFKVVQANNRKVVKNSLVYADGKYVIDFKDFEDKIVQNNVKLFILCSPHNPMGRVWTKEELIKMGEICQRHGCIVVSDEIHCDFVYSGHKHYVFASLSDDFLENSIICTAPSKTFNLAGLQVSNVFIANENLKKAFKEEIGKTGYSQLNTMGLVACQSAYENGSEWLFQLKEYLTENLNFLRSYLKQRIPQIKLVEPEGTYLAWLDFKSLGLEQKELDHLIINKAKLWLNSGSMFGIEGMGFQRINIACPREILKTALERLENTFGN
ncbi:MAG: pyridoxal phosphate-dependent aminotransferase [Eubacteriales bacterium]|jgi:cystathionine beta-lyase|nr:pyridoxal phosphate-dependent aminotransferase [Eubacteriales bacterium]